MKFSKITHIDNTDLESIHTLMRQLSSDAEPLNIENFNELISKGNVSFFCAIKNKKITGMLSLVYYETTTGIRSRIEDVIVLDEFRRQGIAVELIKIAIEEYSNSNSHSLELTSNPKREAANNLYIKLGFKIRKTNVYQYDD